MAPERRRPHRLHVALLAAMVLAATPVLAQGPEPMKQRLPNGLRVVAQGNDYTATVVLTALVRVTALHEPRDAGGIRQLTQMVLATGEGCQEELLAAAMRPEAQVAPDFVGLSVAAPAESLEAATRLLRRLLFRPTLSEQSLELARAELVRNLTARDEVPTTFALDRLAETLYPGVGSGDTTAGDPVEVGAVGLSEVRSFYGRHYLPNATVIGISGGVDAQEAVTLVAREMGQVLPGSLPEQRPEPPAGR
ncbi:MAG TPA: hypothetical protein DEP45_03520, partial [Armatimonadetes bacterium]|nr:hypothetical protein [Armatimonadota bacterium]